MVLYCTGTGYRILIRHTCVVKGGQRHAAAAVGAGGEDHELPPGPSQEDCGGAVPEPRHGVAQCPLADTKQLINNNCDYKFISF